MFKYLLKMRFYTPCIEIGADQKVEKPLIIFTLQTNYVIPSFRFFKSFFFKFILLGTVFYNLFFIQYGIILKYLILWGSCAKNQFGFGNPDLILSNVFLFHIST
jgi:hypothetical protein